MKTKITILTILLGICAGFSQTVTPFFYAGKNIDGSPQTNLVIFQPWPPGTYGTVVNSTNIVFGTTQWTNTPASNGQFTNSYYANMYRVTIPAIGAAFYVNLPQTATTNSLALYVTNSPTFVSWAGYVLNTVSGITNALGYIPPTNTPAGITWALQYTPPTNTYTGITWALGYSPQQAGGYSASGGAASIITNGFLWSIAYQTNANPNTSFTNAPMGSICTTTNGQTYILSNLVWYPY